MAKKSNKATDASPSTNGVLSPSEAHVKFVRAWQSSSSVGEAASKAGTTKAAASHLAMRLRKKGVGLKKMARGDRAATVDVAGLNAVLAEMAQE